jgi:low affinity Fe/Cu permease
MKIAGKLAARFDDLARRTTEIAGSTGAFTLAICIVLAWIVTGPMFHYSDTWQLVINTGTTVVTFLMVFLIQRSQNRDSLAVHLRLNELVASAHGSSNRLINVEDLSGAELRVLHTHYARLAALAKAEEDLRRTHSIEEAEVRQRSKSRVRARARSLRPLR